MLRRQFLIRSASLAAAGLAIGKESLTPKERVDAALAGKDVDRPPFTFWHHFGLKTPEEHAARTLEFHKSYRTDIVKVMSDFPYPKGPAGEWYALQVEENPFPQQIRALELIRAGLNGSNYYIETVFNSWNVAEKLSSRKALLDLKESNPDALLHALNVITDSQIHHARRAFQAGASGILYSVANANSKEISAADYAKFRYPFDNKFLAAIPEGRLNILHLHVESDYLDQFKDVPAPIMNYSIVASKIPVSRVRAQYPARVIAGGIDEVDYRNLNSINCVPNGRMPPKLPASASFSRRDAPCPTIRLQPSFRACRECCRHEQEPVQRRGAACRSALSVDVRQRPVC